MVLEPAGGFNLQAGAMSPIHAGELLDDTVETQSRAPKRRLDPNAFAVREDFKLTMLVR